MSTDYVVKAARNKLVFSLHLKIANDWISRNSAGKICHKYGVAVEKDLSPNVTSIFPLGGSSNKLWFDLRLYIDLVV